MVFSIGAAFGACDSFTRDCLWVGVNVVRGGIAIDDGDGLPSHHADDVRFVLADAWVRVTGSLANVEGASAQSFFNVDENVSRLPPLTTRFSAVFEPAQLES